MYVEAIKKKEICMGYLHLTTTVIACCFFISNIKCYNDTCR